VLRRLMSARRHSHSASPDHSGRWHYYILNKPCRRYGPIKSGDFDGSKLTSQAACGFQDHGG
jgi:hypothetical protein